VGVLGYRTDQSGNAIIGPAWQGSLARRDLVSIGEIAENPARIDRVTQSILDVETGEMIEVSAQLPVWVDPKAEGAAPVCSVLFHSYEVLEQWVNGHPNSFPPIVVLFTAGPSNDGDPIPYADSLKSLATSDGEVVLLTCYLGGPTSATCLFPARKEDVPATNAQELFEMASVLPAGLHSRLASEGYDLAPDARGMAVNADLQLLVRAFDLGTRPRSEAREPFSPPAEVAAKDVPSARYDENVQFTVFRPKVVPPEVWCGLVVSAHLEEKRPGAPSEESDPLEKARTKATAVFGDLSPEQIREATHDSSRAVPQGGQITFVPRIDGVRFNPPSQTVLWEEDEHTVAFRMRAGAALDGKVARGQVTVFLGAILVADIPLIIKVDRAAAATRSEQKQEPVSAHPYRKVFASYSHRDAAIVEQFERYAEAIGDEYLRDCKRLRPGDRWNEKLLDMIDQADVFQLFWSHNSMESAYVRQEWERALKRGREGFIRPVWWEDTFPQRLPDLPPPELAGLHFQRIGGGFGSHVPSLTAGDRPPPIMLVPSQDGRGPGTGWNEGGELGEDATVAVPESGNAAPAGVETDDDLLGTPLEETGDTDAPTELRTDEEFMLTPFEDLAEDESESGSQVIALDAELPGDSAPIELASGPAAAAWAMLDEDFAPAAAAGLPAASPAPGAPIDMPAPCVMGEAPFDVDNRSRRSDSYEILRCIAIGTILALVLFGIAWVCGLW
jgi:hypothetical protein